MTLTIDFSPAEEEQLAIAARQEGLAPEAVVKKLVSEHLPPAQDPTLTLFAQWAQEDAGMTPEEASEENRLWEQFQSGVNETREALGMRRL